MTLAYTMKNLADVGRAMRLSKEGAEREAWPRERLEAFQRERLGAHVRPGRHRRHRSARVLRGSQWTACTP